MLRSSPPSSHRPGTEIDFEYRFRIEAVNAVERGQLSVALFDWRVRDLDDVAVEVFEAVGHRRPDDHEHERRVALLRSPCS